MDEGLACAKSQDLLAYLAGALLNYKYEGVHFAPNIIFCKNIEDVLKVFPGAIRYNVGRASLSANSGSKILKDCAPLSNQNWSVFVERIDENEVTYGVFTYYILPTAVQLHEGIEINDGIFSILLRKKNDNTIELKSAKGNVLSLIFSTLREVTNLEESCVKRFSEDCCVKVDALSPESKAEFRVYLNRLLGAALTSSHGAILLCGDQKKLGKIAALKDFVPVDPPLDFFRLFSEYTSVKSDGSLSSLLRAEELLEGFLRSDGMVAFDQRGRVVAYRTFYRATGAAKDKKEAPVGGARRRAFEGVKTLLGNRIVSALFRSQDGLTIYSDGQNGQ